MNRDKFVISIRGPNERIETERSSVSLNMLFLQSMFDISVKLDDQRTTFSVNLPEWLVAFSDLLNDADNEPKEKLLPLSGERFVGYNRGGRVRVRVFDTSNMKTTWLDQTRDEAMILHEALLNHLQRSVDCAAGRHLEIEDIGRLNLNR